MLSKILDEMTISSNLNSSSEYKPLIYDETPTQFLFLFFFPINSYSDDKSLEFLVQCLNLFSYFYEVLAFSWVYHLGENHCIVSRDQRSKDTWRCSLLRDKT